MEQLSIRQQLDILINDYASAAATNRVNLIEGAKYRLNQALDAIFAVPPSTESENVPSTQPKKSTKPSK